MLAALIIVFREVLEAGLIIGVVLAATRGVPRRGQWVSLGILAGVLGSCVVAAFASQLAGLFQGSGQELFNAAILAFAVIMLAWHNIWMASHGRQMAADVRALGEDVARGNRSAMAIASVVAIAVLREGSEIVLFMFGLSATDGGHPMSVLAGGGLGLLAGALATALIYFGLLAIPVRHFFSVTAALITLLAAGLASQAISFLQAAGYSERWSIPLWNTSSWLPDESWIGRILHTLVGYTDQPTGMQILVYLVTLVGIWSLAKMMQAKAT